MDKDKVIVALTEKVKGFDFQFEYNIARVAHPGVRYFHLYYIVQLDEIHLIPTDENHDDPYTGIAPEIFIGTMNFVSAANCHEYKANKLKALPRYLGL